MVDEWEFNILVINVIEEGVNCMDCDMCCYLGLLCIFFFYFVIVYLEYLLYWDGYDRVSELVCLVSDEM